MIVPRLQKETRFPGTLAFGDTVKFFAADHWGVRAAKLFRYFLPTVPFVAVSNRSEAQLVLECRYGFCDRDECYRILAAEWPVTVQYHDYLGARNAVSTLAQMFVKENGGLVFPCSEILDYPDAKMRSILLDPARGLIPVAELEETIVRLAMAKYNYLHLHLCDSNGYAIHSDVVSYSGPDGKQYTKDEIRHIVRFALDMGIECIPEVDFPAHGVKLLREMPQLACVTDGTEEPSPWAVCAGNEETYRFFEKIYTELAELFPCSIMHIGTDEIEMNDLTDRRTWPTWHCCSRCRELCEREGIDPNNRTEIFYYMLRRIYAILTKLGKRVMLWNDNIDIRKSPELPRDMLIHFWRVAGKNRGPVEGCSMERFLEEGFQVLNSYYPETYIEGDFYPNNDETIFQWSPTLTPAHNEAYNGQILGGAPCAWGTGSDTGPVPDHYPWTLPPSILLFGDRLWNHSLCQDRGAFGVAATRWMFGLEVPAGFDVFAAFGGFMQPRRNDGVRMWADRIVGDLQETDAVLAGLENSWTSFGRLAGIYRDSIRWLREANASERP